MKIMLRVLAKFFVVVLFSLLLLQSGCATIQGMGRDIESAGNAIERAAN